MVVKQKIKININKKMAIGVILPILAIFLLAYFVILPITKNIIITDSAIKLWNSDLDLRLAETKNMSQFAKGLKKDDIAINDLDNVFFKHGQELELINSLEQIAEKNNLTQDANMESVDYSGANYKKVPINIYAKGEISGELIYLEELENFSPEISINSLETIKNVSGKDGKEYFDMFISTQTIWKK
ncbi:MAG: hypothetical protein PHT51_04480 [Patescibacteria group bacterium]|nr:hypothetical protein [Patescibacteria group bacterium]MDD4611264.1 hypothetical protein [Patescibacteria group bacterium]